MSGRSSFAAVLPRQMSWVAVIVSIVLVGACTSSPNTPVDPSAGPIASTTPASEPGYAAKLRPYVAEQLKNFCN